MNGHLEMKKAPIAALARHRIQIDGQGVTTLVCFQGCPLRCKLCPNAFALGEKTENTLQLSPEELYEKVRIDELYFLATGGGVTFGGGEPLLYPDFIEEFRTICGDTWNLCVETSLAVPWEHVETVAHTVDVFYFDCKDINPEIYKSYTGKENTLALDNIQKLSQLVSPDKIIVRIPLIPGFNGEEDREKSVAFFSGLGLKNFDLFTYIEPH